jgi:hypothetical protein
LIDLIDDERISVFGTSPKYLATLEANGVKPRQSHDLSSLKTLLCTGSALSPQSYDYVYRDLKADVCLASMSGGTDIVSCFVNGNPLQPVRRGEMQGKAWAWRLKCGTTTANRSLAKKASWCVPGTSRRCPSACGTTPTAKSCGRRISASSRRLGPGRLRRTTAPRRDDDPWPLRRGAQPRRRAHRHGGNLPPGGKSPAGAGQRGHRPAMAG